MYSKIIKRARTMISNYKGNTSVQGFIEDNNDKSYFAFFKTISIDFVDWTCSSIRVKHFRYPNGHVYIANELLFIQDAFSILLNMTPNKRQEYLLKNDKYPNAIAFLMNDEFMSCVMIVTYVVINEGTQKKLLMFIDEYETSVACWGSKAKLMLDKAGHFVGGRYYHMFYDY